MTAQFDLQKLYFLLKRISICYELPAAVVVHNKTQFVIAAR